MTTTVSTSHRSSSDPLTTDRVVGGFRIRCSTRSDGDFHLTDVPFDELEARRRRFVDLPWTMLDEHHGTTVVRVDRPGHHDGARGDVAITDRPGAVLGCWVGDCAPVVLMGAQHEFAVVHAGWRGLAAGIIDRAVEAFTEPVVGAALGPSIGPCCYEFGPDDLAAVAQGVGADPVEVAGRTRDGEVALDVPAAVVAACARHGIPVDRLAGCTGCTFPGYSHRVRRDRGRHVVAAWRPSGTT